MIPLVAAFAASALVVVLAGIALARSGDVIAAHTRLGGLWVGSMFLAVATSLPELTTDIAAVRLGEADLAAGDLFGSSMANMLILAVVSLLARGEPLFRRAAMDHALYASLAMLLTSIATIAILFRPAFSILGIGPGSLLIAIAYVIGSYAIFQHGTLARETVLTTEAAASAEEPPVAAGAASLRHAWAGFAAAAVVILIVAPLFARTAARLAEVSGLGSTVVGTWLVGVATSLPELATSLAAVRLGAYDLAVGNLFGSNALNMALFVPLDLAHGQGPLLSMVDPAHAISALAGMALMATAMAALIYRARGKYTLLQPGSIVMILTYFAGLALIFFRSRGPSTP